MALADSHSSTVPFQMSPGSIQESSTGSESLTLPSMYRRARTFSRAPRVRKMNIHEKDGIGVTAEETFWNIMFSNAFGPGAVGHFFIEDNYVSGAVYLLCFYTTFTTSAGYAGRFNDTDVLHRILWVVHGVLIAGMLSRTGTDETPLTFHWFCTCCAATKLLMALMYARVAFYLPAARRVAVMSFLFLSVQSAMLFSVTGWLTRQNDLEKEWVVLPLLALEVANVPDFLSARIRCCGKRLVDPVPLSIEFMTARFSSLMVMLLGLMIVHTVTECRKWTGVGVECWSVSFSNIVFAVFMNVLLHQASKVDFELHALRISFSTAWLWFLSQLLFVVSITMTSAGFADTLKECTSGAQPSPHAQAKAGFGAAAMFVVICVLDFIHDTPCRRCRRRQLDRGRGDRCCGYMSRKRQARLVSHFLGIVVAVALRYAPLAIMAPALAALALLQVLAFALAKRLRQRHRDTESRRQTELMSYDEEGESEHQGDESIQCSDLFACQER